MTSTILDGTGLYEKRKLRSSYGGCAFEVCWVRDAITIINHGKAEDQYPG